MTNETYAQVPLELIEHLRAGNVLVTAVPQVGPHVKAKVVVIQESLESATKELACVRQDSMY